MTNHPPILRFLLLSILMIFPIRLTAQVVVGADQIASYYPLLMEKKIGVVANQTSVTGNGHLIDRLIKDGFQIVKIFSPEHGFRMVAEAGELVDNAVDSATRIPVVSLYGAKKQPSEDDLSGLDVILFDIQDVGVRFYTYISTLTYIMEACASHDLTLIVLDRPNPNAFYIDGPVLEPDFTSFVGLHPVPIVYGMTIGEYALMVNGEGWLKSKSKCNLRVIKLANYTHQSKVNLPVQPSPNLPNATAIELYPSLCLFEGTIISVGRGTPYPFQVYGHPLLPCKGLEFTPVSVPGRSLHPPLEGKLCCGEDLRSYFIKHPADEGKINLGWLIKASREYTGKESFFNDYFNKLAGNETLQAQIKQHKSEQEIRKTWQPGLKKFRKIRQKYLLY